MHFSLPQSSGIQDDDVDDDEEGPNHSERPIVDHIPVTTDPLALPTAAMKVHSGRSKMPVAVKSRSGGSPPLHVDDKAVRLLPSQTNIDRLEPGNGPAGVSDHDDYSYSKQRGKSVRIHISGYSYSMSKRTAGISGAIFNGLMTGSSHCTMPRRVALGAHTT